MLDKLKTLLGITDSEKDFALQFVIDAVTDMVLNYCNIEKLPPQLENTVLSICMDKYRADSIGQEQAQGRVTGAEGACAVNSSLTNKTYNGEYTIFAEYTQSELEKAIKDGEFTFHKVGNDVNVLTDITSLTTLTEDKNELFQSNQTVRVCDQIGNDIAVLFNTKYIGKIPNDASGRVSLWTDVTKYMKELLTLRVIEDFEDEDVTVSAGQTKTAVVVDANITVVNAVEKLYMTVRIS